MGIGDLGCNTSNGDHVWDWIVGENTRACRACGRTERTMPTGGKLRYTKSELDGAIAAYAKVRNEEMMFLAGRVCALSDALRDLLPYAKTRVPNPINVGEENVISKAERLLGEDLKQCDCCGEMKPDVTSSYVSYAGDTSACEDCRNTQP